jgi:hypothetical protein
VVKVKKKAASEAIETLPLPFDEPPRRRKERRQSQRSVAFAICPKHQAVKPTGLVRVGEHLVWREHHYVTWAGTRRPCPASGVAVCLVSPKEVTKGAARCSHAPDVWSGNDGAA